MLKKQPLQIIVYEGMRQAGNFQSRVEEVREENLVLAYPSETGVRDVLTPEKPVMLQIIAQEAVFRLHTKVVELWEIPKAVIVEKVGRVEKLQRRKYLRWPAEFPVGFIAFDDSLTPTTSSPISGSTRDVSGGGVQFETYTELQLESLIDITVNFPQFQIQAIGKIRRLQEVQPTNGYNYRYGLEYVDIDENDRKRIISFVLEQQRESRKRN